MLSERYGPGSGSGGDVRRLSTGHCSFEVIAETIPRQLVAAAPQTADKGERLIRLEPHVVAKLRAMRGPGESYSEVILRLAAVGRASLNGS